MISGPTADGSPRATKNPYSLDWKLMREEFYGTKEPALGAIGGKRDVKGTKAHRAADLQGGPQTLEAWQARRHAKAKR